MARGARASGILPLVKTAALVLVAIAMAFAGVTWWAAESSQVALLETRRPDGSTRTTHVWYVRHDGSLWLEAGTPENGWYRDVARSPRLAIEIDGQSAEYRTEPVLDASGHAFIRGLMREKYALRDRWVGLLFDTSRSVAVRLVEPEDSPNPSPRRRSRR
jgi:hypothetical protein